MFSVSFLLIAAAQLLLFGVFVRRFAARRQVADLIPTALTAVLAYENAVIGLGRWVGEGPLLETLNTPRFIAHAVLTPMLMLWGLALLRRQSVAWALRTGTAVSVGAIVAFLVVYDATFDIFGLDLAPETWADTLRYANLAAPEGPPLAAILTGLALIIVGGQSFLGTRSNRLLLAAIVMAAVAGLAGYSPILGNLGELALMAGILTELREPPTARAMPKGEISRWARRFGWITWPVFLLGGIITYIPLWGTYDPDAGLPVSADQYAFGSAIQGFWLVLLTIHAHYSILVYGLGRHGTTLRRFHIWFGHANLALTFGGQMLFLFPQTASIGSAATQLVLLTITLHVLLGTYFAIRRGRTRRRPRPAASPA